MAGTIHKANATRTRRRPSGLTVQRLQYVACADPRGVIELDETRGKILGELVQRCGAKRIPFEMHRRQCAIVREHDDTAECTCRPLALHTGAQA